jgi:uncharacterized protein YfdQ (DUF2303 family)
MTDKTTDKTTDPTYVPIVADELLSAAAGRIPDNDAGIKAIVDLTNKAAELEEVTIFTNGTFPGLPDEIPMFFDHRPNMGVVDIRPYMERFRTHPERRSGTAKVTTLDSFVELVNRHKTPHSAIFASTAWPQPALTGIIDYHETGQGKPGHLHHRVLYDFPITDELKAWIANNNKVMKQAEFAAFLEEHSAELSAPFAGEESHYQNLFKERIATPTEVVSLSRHLEVFVGARAKQGIRLQTGERVVEFSEEHTNGKGDKVDIPGCFIISVHAFVGGEAVRIAARLRYRIAAGDINWFYSLYRWDVELRNRVKNDLAEAAKQTALPAYEGSPEA